MTTTKQIRDLLDQLQSRHQDIVVVGPFAVLTPIRHVIGSISIDRTGSADRPHFLWAIGHAFNPFSSLQGIWLDQFRVARGAPSKWSQPGMAEAFLEVVEAEILPRLRSATTIDAMLNLRFPYSFGFEGSLRYEPHQIHFHAAHGRFTAAIAILDKIENWDRSKMSWRLREFEYVIDELGPLLRQGDKVAVATLLHNWEAMVVKRAGVGAFHERTPFPLELADPG